MTKADIVATLTGIPSDAKVYAGAETEVRREVLGLRSVRPGEITLRLSSSAGLGFGLLVDMLAAGFLIRAEGMRSPSRTDACFLHISNRDGRSWSGVIAYETAEAQLQRVADILYGSTPAPLVNGTNRNVG